MVEATTVTLAELIEQSGLDVLGSDPASQDYGNKVDNLVKLYKLKFEDDRLSIDYDLKNREVSIQENKNDQESKLKELEQSRLELELAKEKQYQKLPWYRKVSPETKALVAANIVGIGAILLHEQVQPIGTKALGLVLKLKP